MEDQFDNKSYDKILFELIFRNYKSELQDDISGVIQTGLDQNLDRVKSNLASIFHKAYFLVIITDDIIIDEFEKDLEQDKTTIINQTTELNDNNKKIEDEIELLK